MYDTKKDPTCSWTGLHILEDLRVRKEGKKIWVFEYLDRTHTLFATDDPAVAQEHWERGEWDAYLIMWAENTDLAKVRFYDAQDQCNAYLNGVVDWVNVVHLAVEHRPETGPIHRPVGDTNGYGEWVAEYKNRYGVEVQ